MAISETEELRIERTRIEMFRRKQEQRYSLRPYRSTDSLDGLSADDRALVLALQDLKAVREQFESKAAFVVARAQGAQEALTRGEMPNRLTVLQGGGFEVEVLAGQFNMGARIVTIMLQARNGYAPELLTPEENAAIEIGQRVVVSKARRNGMGGFEIMVNMHVIAYVNDEIDAWRIAKREYERLYNEWRYERNQLAEKSAKATAGSR